MRKQLPDSRLSGSRLYPEHIKSGFEPKGQSTSGLFTEALGQTPMRTTISAALIGSEYKYMREICQAYEKRETCRDAAGLKASSSKPQHIKTQSAIKFHCTLLSDDLHPRSKIQKTPWRSHQPASPHGALALQFILIHALISGRKERAGRVIIPVHAAAHAGPQQIFSLAPLIERLSSG